MKKEEDLPTATMDEVWWFAEGENKQEKFAWMAFIPLAATKMLKKTMEKKCIAAYDHGHPKNCSRSSEKHVVC